MKLYKIRDWAALFENNRSRTVKELAWVPIPNRHDGENYSMIMSHPEGAKIFAAWILLLQVASRCQHRGTLLRDNQKPHTPATLSMKTRAPENWFILALDFLENNTDWLEISDDCQHDDIEPTANRQSGDEEGKGMEGNGKNEGKGINDHKKPNNGFKYDEVLDAWNSAAESCSIPKCLIISDARRQKLSVRSKDQFFRSNWRSAITRISQSKFCNGANDRNWRASFDWFIQPDSVAKVMEGKYDDRLPHDQKAQAELTYIPDSFGDNGE